MYMAHQGHNTPCCSRKVVQGWCGCCWSGDSWHVHSRPRYTRSVGPYVLMRHPRADGAPRTTTRTWQQLTVSACHASWGLIKRTPLGGFPKRPLRDTPSPSASLLVVTSAPPHSQTDPQPSPAAGPTMSARHGHHRPPPGAAVVCIHTSFPHRAASASRAQHFTPSVLAPLLPCTHKAWCLPAGGAPLQAAQVDQQPASTQRWFQPQQQLTHQVSSN